MKEKDFFNQLLAGWEADVRSVVEAVFPSVLSFAREEKPWRTGGWFCATINAQSVGFPIGTLTAEDERKFRTFADEKTCRLGIYANHISSWQSRNREDQRYGGAIRVCGGAILSFSGLSDHYDELLVLLVAMRLGAIDAAGRSRVIRASNNTRIGDYILKFGDMAPL